MYCAERPFNTLQVIIKVLRFCFRTIILSILVRKLQLFQQLFYRMFIIGSFYRCTTDSILTNCITEWYGSSTVSNNKKIKPCKGWCKPPSISLVPNLQPLNIFTTGDVCVDTPSLGTPPSTVTNCSIPFYPEEMQQHLYQNLQAQGQFLPHNCYPFELYTTPLSHPCFTSCNHPAILFYTVYSVLYLYN